MSPPSSPPLLSSTNSRPRPNLNGMCGTAGRAMRVGRAPLKRAERAPGPPSLSPALPAIRVLQPGLEHLRPPPSRGASRGATGVSQVSNGSTGGYRAFRERWLFGGPLGEERGQSRQAQRDSLTPTPNRPRTFLHICVCVHSKSMFTCVLDPGTVPRAPSHFSRLPLGGWAEDGQSASRHPEPVPEEGSEDELPPQVHKVRAPGPENDCYWK